MGCSEIKFLREALPARKKRITKKYLQKPNKRVLVRRETRSSSYRDTFLKIYC